MSDYFVHNVKEVQITRDPEPEPKPVLAIPPVEIKLQASYVNKDAIDALLMGMREPVQAPKEIEFVGHGVTGRLRNIAFHDDGQPSGNGGMVTMAVTGDLVDVSFASSAKNRAWRRLQRRKMLLRCRQRERSWKLSLKVAKQILETWSKTPFVLADIQAASHTLTMFDELEKSKLWTRENLEDLNYVRGKLGLSSLTEEDL